MIAVGDGDNQHVGSSWLENLDDGIWGIWESKRGCDRLIETGKLWEDRHFRAELRHAQGSVPQDASYQKVNLLQCLIKVGPQNVGCLRSHWAAKSSTPRRSRSQFVSSKGRQRFRNFQLSLFQPSSKIGRGVLQHCLRGPPKCLEFCRLRLPRKI